MNAPGMTSKQFAAVACIALLIALIGAGACYAIVGPNVGLFFGGLVFAALLVPPLTLMGDRLAQRLLIAGCVCDGIAIVWLVAWLGGHVTLIQCLLCYALLIAWCFALGGIVIALHRIGSISAAAITTVLALLWLASPIWLWPHLAGATQWLVPIHPLFAMNSVLVNLGIWTERPIAYRYLLTLGQDVPYELPRTILPAAMVHLVVGAVGVLAWRLFGKVRP
jgi:hypothetical protein